jgi:hypothetical protein
MVEVTPEEFRRLRSGRPATLSPIEHRMLARAVAYLWPDTNCAPGTHGAALIGLVRRGLMRESEGAGVFEYRVTRAGRDAYVSYGPPYVPATPDPSASS